MNIGSTGPVGLPSAAWADDSGVQGFPTTPQDPVLGYFIEYEGAGAPPVPGLGARGDPPHRIAPTRRGRQRALHRRTPMT
jgi:hypothetical protein